MSTRSRIAKQDASGKVTMIYCHSDGYLTGNGKLLLEHYQDEAKIDALLALGDISMLGSKLGAKHDFDLGMKFGRPGFPKYDSPEFKEFYDTVLAYARDRGEKDVAAATFPSRKAIPQDLFEEFFYLRKGGKWFYSDNGSFMRVKELTAERIAAR